MAIDLCDFPMSLQDGDAEDRERISEHGSRSEAETIPMDRS